MAAASTMDIVTAAETADVSWEQVADTLMHIHLEVVRASDWVAEEERAEGRRDGTENQPEHRTATGRVPSPRRAQP